MRNIKLCGVLKEIIEHPNIDATAVLERELTIPRFKAEELAARIQKKWAATQDPEPERESLFEKTAQAEQPGVENVYAVDCLGEKEFEHFMTWLLKELGYTIESVESEDWGVDFVVVGGSEKIGVQAVQCPKTHRVSDLIIRLSQQAQSNHGCSRSIAVSTSCFTEQALKAAEKGCVELWDNNALQQKIGEVTRKDEGTVKSRFPAFQESLLASLLHLEKTKDFMIEAKVGGKYDVHLPGVKYPLLTLQANGGVVTRCICRIRYYEPVAESEGEAIVDKDNGLNPDAVQAYASIIQYLEQFLE